MSDHTSEELRKHLKVYIGVFVALLVGTLLTVWAWTFHFHSVAVTVSVALFIACVKASLVAGFFMHLISERKTIYAIMVATFVFFCGLLYLTVYSRESLPVGTVYLQDRPGLAEVTEPMSP